MMLLLKNSRIIKDQCNEKITRQEARLSDLNVENHNYFRYKTDSRRGNEQLMIIGRIL